MSITKQKIVFLGPDGAGKSSVIQGLMKSLAQEGRAAQMRYLKPQIIMKLRSKAAVNPVPHGKTPRGAIFSLAKIFLWLIDEWAANLFRDQKGILIICDRYYHDLLVDPVRYRYGGPTWAAKLVGKLMPLPMLWVILDAPAEVLQARKQEVTPQESARQRQAYLDFVRKQRRYAVIDASQALDKVIADTHKAVAAELKEDGSNRG